MCKAKAFFERHFRTAKYRAKYPERGFADMGEARAWASRFVHGYDHDHRHGGIRYASPAQRHEGRDGEILAVRHRQYERTRNWRPIEAVTTLTRTGLFLVEDAHTLSVDDSRGRLLHEAGAIAFFKRLSDRPSFQVWQDQTQIGTWMCTCFDPRHLPACTTEGWVESAEFRSSRITIRKSERAGHDKLGERIVVGTEAAVQTWGGRLPTSR